MGIGETRDTSGWRGFRHGFPARIPSGWHGFPDSGTDSADGLRGAPSYAVLVMPICDLRCLSSVSPFSPFS